MKKITLGLVALGLLTKVYASEYTFEMFTGFVKNAKEDLVIYRDNGNSIDMNDVQFETHPQTVPYYYGMRISKWYSDDTAWEFEHVHQKLYIDNPEQYYAGLTNWEVTDGYNFFMLNKAWKQEDKSIILRVGGGFIISHPDVTLDGERLHGDGSGALVWGTGYHLSGFVLQTSAQKTFDINKNWFLGTEVKASYSRAYIQVPNGGVFVQNRALHFDFGFGYKF